MQSISPRHPAVCGAPIHRESDLSLCRLLSIRIPAQQQAEEILTGTGKMPVPPGYDMTGLPQAAALSTAGPASGLPELQHLQKVNAK